MMKRGFTLVEMLVVITIIGMLAFLGVSSYGAAQKQARLELAADNVVSLLKEQQGLAKSGRVGLSGSAKCYGVRLLINNAPKVVEADYFAVQGNKADFCNIDNETERPLIQELDVVVSNLKQGFIDKDDLTIMFKPPSAKVVVYSGKNEISIGSENEAQIDFSISILNREGEKKISIHALTGKAQRIYE
jgi:prepilin-type N-terminal cleavage/methylation domain-containing protein